MYTFKKVHICITLDSRLLDTEGAELLRTASGKPRALWKTARGARLIRAWPCRSHPPAYDRAPNSPRVVLCFVGSVPLDPAAGVLDMLGALRERVSECRRPIGRGQFSVVSCVDDLEQQGSVIFAVATAFLGRGNGTLLGS